MRLSERISSDRYTDIDYHQFTRGPGVKVAMAVAGILCWPLVLPMALLSRISDFVFRTFSELLALVPYLFGVIVRYEYYRWTLTQCGRNVSIGFGTVFFYRDISIGDNVEIGNFNAVHYCDFGSYLLIADACHFLSGSRYHNIERMDIPMALQGGSCAASRSATTAGSGRGPSSWMMWRQGCVIGAGSVLTAATEPYTVVAGNPAKVIRRRE